MTIKIILAVLILQVILLIFLKGRNRKIILITMLVTIGIGAWEGVKEYNRKNKDLSKTQADVKISAINLISEYEMNDSASNQKYLGKVVEVTGNVKKLENDGGNYTIVLGEQNSLSSVRCTMDTTYRSDAAAVTEGSSVIIRGLCTGFKKNELLGEDLGSGVELNRSVIINNKK